MLLQTTSELGFSADKTKGPPMDDQSRSEQLEAIKTQPMTTSDRRLALFLAVASNGLATDNENRQLWNDVAAHVNRVHGQDLGDFPEGTLTRFHESEFEGHPERLAEELGDG